MQLHGLVLLMLAQSANPSFFLADCVLEFTVEPNKLALIAFSEHSKLSRRKLSQFFKAIGNFIFQTPVFGIILGTHDWLDARTEFLAPLPQGYFIVRTGWQQCVNSFEQLG